MSARQVLLICGQHPSGLSMILTGLRALGCQAGHFPDLRDASSATMHYSLPEFVDINDSLISGRPIEDLGPAAQALLARFPDPSPIVLKDPRARLALPFWHAQIRAWGGRMRLLFVIHSPDGPNLQDMVATGRWLGDLGKLLQHGFLQAGDLILIPMEQLRADAAGALRDLTWNLGLQIPLDMSPAFDAWIMGHAALPAHPQSDLQTQASIAARAVYAALFPNGRVVALSAGLARQTIDDTLRNLETGPHNEPGP